MSLIKKKIFTDISEPNGNEKSILIYLSPTHVSCSISVITSAISNFNLWNTASSKQSTPFSRSRPTQSEPRASLNRPYPATHCFLWVNSDAQAGYLHHGMQIQAAAHRRQTYRRSAFHFLMSLTWIKHLSHNMQNKGEIKRSNGSNLVKKKGFFL